MKITHCKLLRKQQLKLLEYFVLEVTARSAADILDIQPNTAMLFYRKIRQVISHHVELQATEIFDGAVELNGGRYWVRTSDPCRVKAVLYR
jgi:transposase